jgi:hypothetical protein
MAWQCIEALGGSLVLPSSTLCRHNSTRIVTLIFSDRLESTWRAGKMRLDLRGVYAVRCSSQIETTHLGGDLVTDLVTE